MIMIPSPENINRDIPEVTLDRFIRAQNLTYETALAEIRNGRKLSHWIWYIFPQLRRLGFSANANFYGIADAGEAKAYLAHSVLGPRLREITSALLNHKDKSAAEILTMDALKVRSCMTLFDIVSPNDVFAQVLDRFYGGARCEFTMRIYGVSNE